MLNPVVSRKVEKSRPEPGTESAFREICFFLVLFDAAFGAGSGVAWQVVTNLQPGDLAVDPTMIVRRDVLWPAEASQGHLGPVGERFFNDSEGANHIFCRRRALPPLKNDSAQAQRRSRENLLY